MHNELEVDFQSCTMAPVSNTYVTGLFSITEIPLLRWNHSAQQVFESQDFNLYQYYLLVLFCLKLAENCMSEIIGNIAVRVCNAAHVNRTEKS